jgi:hypothetical protein
MRYIKEPKGVDFIIKSDPLTDEAKKEISAFIAQYKKNGIKNIKSIKKKAEIKKRLA